MTDVKASCAIPVFFVESVKRSISWYRDALGWQLDFVWPDDSDDPSYGSVCFGGAMIHLSECNDPSKRQPAHAYVLLSGVDAYGEALACRGVALEGPKTWEHGMREVAVRDPDGNCICFGQSDGQHEVPGRGEPTLDP